MNSRFDPRPDGDPGSWPNDEFFDDREEFGRDFDERREPTWFSDYVDGELSQEERDQCDRILAEDPDLARCFDSYRERVRLCVAIGAAERRVDGGTALRAKILEDASRHMPAAQRRGFGFAFGASISLAAASVILFFVLQHDRDVGITPGTASATSADELEDLARSGAPEHDFGGTTEEGRLQRLALTDGAKESSRPVDPNSLVGLRRDGADKKAADERLRGEQAARPSEADPRDASELSQDTKAERFGYEAGRLAKGAGGGGAQAAPALQKSAAGPSTPGPSAPSSEGPGSIARGARDIPQEMRRRARGGNKAAKVASDEAAESDAATDDLAKKDLAKNDPVTGTSRGLAEAEKKSKVALEQSERAVLTLREQGKAGGAAGFLGSVAKTPGLPPAELRANVLRFDVPASDVTRFYEVIDAQKLARVQIADATRLARWSKQPSEQDKIALYTSNLTLSTGFAVQPGDVLLRIEGERAEVVRGTVALLGQRSWNPREATLAFALASPAPESKAGLVAKSVSNEPWPPGGGVAEKASQLDDRANKKAGSGTSDARKAPAKKSQKPLLEDPSTPDRNKISDLDREAQRIPSRVVTNAKGWAEWHRALELAGDKTRSSLLVYVRVIDAAPAQRRAPDPVKKAAEIENGRALDPKSKSPKKDF